MIGDKYRISKKQPWGKSKSALDDIFIVATVGGEWEDFKLALVNTVSGQTLNGCVPVKDPNKLTKKEFKILSCGFKMERVGK